MREIILQALKKAVEEYPEIKDYLKGDARLIANIYAYKIGESPDDAQRIEDEIKLARSMGSFLGWQLEYIIREIRKYKGHLPFNFWETMRLRMFNEIGDNFIGIMVHGVDGGIWAMGAGTSGYVNRDNMNISLINYARRYKNDWLSYINNTTRDFVETSIADWMNSGESIDKLVRSLRDSTMFDKVRAQRIAVTEVTRLYAMGNQAVWEASKIIDLFTWMTANDERVCELCGPNEGKQFPLSELSNLIPAHVNCRCWGTPVVNLEKLKESYDWS